MGSCCASSDQLKQKIKNAHRANYLSVRSLKLTSVPSEVRTLNVRSLDMGDNMIQSLNINVESLSNLQVLILDQNSLSNLPEFTSSTLKKLNLNNNKLSSLPSMALPSLKELYLNRNTLVSLDSLVGCNSVEQIEASSNKISSLPPFLCDLPMLERIDLSNNAICELNLEWKPSNLKVINLEQNKIAAVPEDMLRNTNLCRIRLVHNIVTQESFIKFPGADVYLERRKSQQDKKISGGVYSNLGILE